MGKKTIATLVRRETLWNFRNQHIKINSKILSHIEPFTKNRKDCPGFSTCANDLETMKINANAYYSVFCRDGQKVESSDYQRVIRLRQIGAEKIFAVLKEEHKLNKIQKREIRNATKECLLSATALNLKG